MQLVRIIISRRLKLDAVPSKDGQLTTDNFVKRKKEKKKEALAYYLLKYEKKRIKTYLIYINKCN